MSISYIVYETGVQYFAILEIERGRYNKLAIEERICKTCNSGQVEDEKHIILHCATYNKFRTVLFSIINKEEPGCLEGSTFLNIMSTINVKLMFSLCKYLQKVFKTRNNLLS